MNPSSSRAISTDTVPDWRDRGDCRRIGEPELWFPKGTTEADAAQAAEAKAFCRECPVAMTCALWALEIRATDGVWGGMDPAQRRTLLRRATKRGVGPRDLADDVRAIWEADARGPLVDAYLDRTQQGDDGHVWWRGTKTSYPVAGRDLTPAQIAFELGYGRTPQGHVKATCGWPYCVAPEHLADGAMRWIRDRMATAA